MAAAGAKTGIFAGVKGALGKAGSAVISPFSRATAETAEQTAARLKVVADIGKAGIASKGAAVARTTKISELYNAMKFAKTPADKQAIQQALKNMGAKRRGYGLVRNVDGSLKVGNIMKIALATGVAGVFAWLTFRGFGSGTEAEALAEELDPDGLGSEGLLDMGSPQFAWMLICMCCCMCCMCLIFSVMAATSD